MSEKKECPKDLAEGNTLFSIQIVASVSLNALDGFDVQYAEDDSGEWEEFPFPDNPLLGYGDPAGLPEVVEPLGVIGAAARAHGVQVATMVRPFASHLASDDAAESRAEIVTTIVPPSASLLLALIYAVAQVLSRRQAERLAAETPSDVGIAVKCRDRIYEAVNEVPEEALRDLQREAERARNGPSEEDTASG